MGIQFDVEKNIKTSFILCIILISLESLTRRYKRIYYWHMYKSLKHIHVSVAFTCSFIIITQMAQFMFFALNQWVLDSTCERVAWKILLLWIHATTVFVSYISCSKIQMMIISASSSLFLLYNNTNHAFFMPI